MKYIKTFEQFISEDIDKSNYINEDVNYSKELELNESSAIAIIFAAQLAMLLGNVLTGTHVLDPLADYVEDKIDSIKSTYNRWRKKRMTEETYKEFADAIPALYTQLENNWKEQIVILKRELDAAIAAKQQFLLNKGDKRTKEWTNTSRQINIIKRQINEFEKKDFFKYIYTTEAILKKNKELFPGLDDATEEQIRLIAQMIRDYIKYGKVKDNYWTERKYK